MRRSRRKINTRQLPRRWEAWADRRTNATGAGDVHGGGRRGVKPSIAEARPARENVAALCAGWAIVAAVVAACWDTGAMPSVADERG